MVWYRVNRTYICSYGQGLLILRLYSAITQYCCVCVCACVRGRVTSERLCLRTVSIRTYLQMWHNLKHNFNYKMSILSAVSHNWYPVISFNRPAVCLQCAASTVYNPVAWIVPNSNKSLSQSIHQAHSPPLTQSCSPDISIDRIVTCLSASCLKSYVFSR